MTIFERAHDALLKRYWRDRLKTKHAPEGRVLIFADLALGDLCFFLPVINALKDRPHTVICNNPDRAEVIKLITPNVEPIDGRFAQGTYGTVVCNFQQQWTPIIRKVLSLEIPTRIGHFNLEREKYQWLWNHKIPYLRDYHRAVVNEWLLWPFGIHHPEPVKLPKTEKIWDYDVVIAPRSMNGIGYKDWPGHGQVVRELRASGYRCAWCVDQLFPDALLSLVSNSRLIIGNDSGLPKLADAMGIPAIQIHLKSGPCTPRVAGVLHGHNLVEPTVREVVTLARSILEG